MIHGKRILATSLLTVASLAAFAGSLRAQTYTEPAGVGAGSTLATAGIAGAASTITGSLNPDSDVDLYQFTLGSAASSLTLTASSVSATYGGTMDTTLYLFDSTGAPLAANEDQSGFSFDASILYTGTIPAGTYYVGITTSGIEPYNTANQSLFSPASPTTVQRTPATGLNPNALSVFTGPAFSPEIGTYSIGVAFTAVPEPSTYAMLALGAAAGFVVLRQRRQQAA